MEESIFVVVKISSVDIFGNFKLAETSIFIRFIQLQCRYKTRNETWWNQISAGVSSKQCGGNHYDNDKATYKSLKIPSRWGYQ